MAPSNLSHRRTHNLLLISKLLNQRDNTSPFTLVLDSLEQPARPLLREYSRRATSSKSNIIFLSFETFPRPDDDTIHFIPCHDKSPPQVIQAVASGINSIYSSTPNKRFLLIVDSMVPLAILSSQQHHGFNLSTYLSSLLIPPRQSPQAQIALVAAYHTDIPSSNQFSTYSPNPLTLLSYLATTIMTVHSLPQLLAEKAAREKSLATPIFGLAEETEGVVIGLVPGVKLRSPVDKGIVIELEHRRKSGRGVVEWYFLPKMAKVSAATPQPPRETIMLLDDHALYRKRADDSQTDNGLAGLTFDLALTERQRQERECVVLPYIDAQKAGGGGEGGRILYDMGIEDDFDEEEDEI